jgi:aminoglycoside 6-adenylyltransferase
MRSDADMLELILETARSDPRIRAVMLNGSRANPRAARDVFQDFDIVYLVTEIDSFKADQDWIDRFGERMVMQLPDDFEPVPSPDQYAYLLQCVDGHRIDLTLKVGRFETDSLSVLLLEKDGTIVPPAPPNEADYLPEMPTAKAFFECCNEFWWVAPYVAKGLWRSEPIFAFQHFNILRDQLVRMLEWHIGTRTDFQQSSGKLGKHFQRLLSTDHWMRLQKTFADADAERTWDAMFVLMDLFTEVALEVAQHFRFEYPHEDDQKVRLHLEHVRRLPKDARTMY